MNAALDNLTREAIARHCDEWAAGVDLDGKRLVVLIPDHTRTCPMDIMFRELHRVAAGRVASLDILVALGTHPPLTRDQLLDRVGITAAQAVSDYSQVQFHNHAWDDPAQLATVGLLDARETAALSGGRLSLDVPVEVNRRVLDADMILIIGPVFPHEVVGFSGGNKYLFPGVSGPAVLNFFHWLGAVITNAEIIGVRDTPVRAVVDRAAAMIPVDRQAWCMVVEGDGLAGLFCGAVDAVWPEAAALSSARHIEWLEAPLTEVLSCCPPMYDELWTAAKCMYKVEPAVADGGRVIIYAPHLKEISVAHGAYLREIGYHTRDYFVRQWDRFKEYPWGVLAHSTHLKGAGTYEGGIERPRLEVVLASQMSQEECRRVNLGWQDWREIDLAAWRARQDPGVLMIPKAGERLYKVRSPLRA